MATPDRRVVSRPRGPGWGHQGSGACLGSLDDLPCEGTQELAPAQLTMLRKAQEFFQTCDAEGKGFITRRDMQRLHEELPLSLEDLEDVFDALDADGNGFLTPVEFTTGFSHFFFSQKPSEEHAAEHLAQLQEEKVYQTRGCEGLGDMDEDEEGQFQMLMDRLGAQKVWEDENDVKKLWLQLKKDEPHLLSNFEDFLTRIFSQLLEAHEEKNELECALKKKSAAYDEEIQHLYEEMEQLIKSEEEQFLLKDTERFQACSQELERKLFSKEQELERLIQKQKRLEGQCTALHNDKHETKAENAKLKLTNQELAGELERTSWELQDAQQQLESLQQEARKLHQEKEMEVYRVTESLQREKSGLLKQLDFLRERNKYLRDERDICFQKDKAAKANTAASKASQKQRSGSVIGKYVDGGGMLRSQSEEEEDVFGILRRRSSLGLSGHPLTEEGPGTGGLLPQPLRRIMSIEEDPLPQLLGGGSEQPLGQCPEEGEASDRGAEGQIGPSRPLDLMPASPQGQPVGKETPSKEEGSVSTPDRLFKIVFVGNSSVGKTSFLSRFCDGKFSPGSAATMGIDYRMKTVRVDDSRVALQLWDTAGQERYRCITQQFFRKADGVVVMYDLTARQSFLAVRPWLSSVEEAVGDRIPVLLLGNKVDNEKEREVPRGLGEQLAKEHNLIFYECSAYSGHNTQESVLHLARILKEQEDTVREDTIQIDRPAKKKACCG
ncbi:EF-hand calcium-binding domain-containing protein 4B isoform X1 [Delphinapterus leucas]|uniref:EF-hand calcium-binding domain-containing protein 4B isoform X1 n=1 Tax=Delphinapterus leucas TaxID=9749 RepID=A0A2Y9NG74_DELLE|nr:EF-hand calcium-binding domain-containing protein 4B isoform X1 [Delphinapterus leucas]XP_022433037.1 EF-hand calcium-binding domain-containing protein 4B isoform X1 [Delphinapterus leucas]XP_022433038.1 EF-hand calcium-binding domain-containing protein 4B isoform X1 [Delphinapterus leucas]XP_022433040.1 EF-hand calcium-binding domain-containing protein 4B isoform X1 [Delphinapterus leucas]XP_022433041.1 EF-hand calcium-binding domain-containing protein 4B isoform X1 [Delphinapterus leucas]